MSDALFRSKAPGIMNLLMADFALDIESAAAILGNLGHESGGFRLMQEQTPLSGRGGWGWAQWTGPRREQFEAYVARNGFDPSSDTANYKWLYLELKGDERAAIPAVKNAVGLDAKVRAFEMAFERAHKDYKHYPERLDWATKALAAYHDNPGGTIDVRDAAGVPAKDGEILPPAITGQAGQPDLGRILAMLLPLLQYVVTDPKLRGPVLPLVLQILGVQPAEAKPTEPTKPAASVNPVTKGSLLAGIAAALAGGAAQLNGTIAPPIGEASTLAGIVTTLAPIAIAAFGGPIGGVVSKILSGISFTRKPS